MLEIKIDFPDTLIDIDRKITLTGAPAKAEVVISTKTERAGQVWRSQMTAQSDASGQVDLNAAMNLIYTQRSESAAATHLFPLSVYHSLQTEVHASCAGQYSSEQKPAVITQRLTNSTVQRVEVREQGLKGVLFIPDGPVAPAVLVLKRQADQVLDEAHAALYAARGYTAFALDYESTPDINTQATELSYFANALDWLREKMRPKHHFVAVSGYEQGAELALLLGVHLAAKVSAVLACEPTASVLPDYPLAVETIQGPLLLASGKKHSSSAYHQAIGQRLEQYGFDYNFQWYDFEGVAAGLSFPHVPTTLHASDTEQIIALAQANKALWFSMIALLHQAVAEAAPGGALGQKVQ